MIGWDFDGDFAAEEFQKHAFAVGSGLSVVDCEVTAEGTDDDLDGVSAWDGSFGEADDAVSFT